jgi:hypothetical protein
LFTNTAFNPFYLTSQYTYNGLYSANTTNTVRCRALDGYSNVGAGVNAGLSSALTHSQLSITSATSGHTQTPTTLTLKNTANTAITQATNTGCSVQTTTLGQTTLLTSAQLAITHSANLMTLSPTQFVMRDTANTFNTQILNYGFFANEGSTASAEMRSTFVKLTSGAENANLTKDGLSLTGIAPTETVSLTTNNFSISNASGSTVASATSVRVSMGAENANLTKNGLLLTGTGPTEFADVRTDGVFISSTTDFASLEDNSVRVQDTANTFSSSMVKNRFNITDLVNAKSVNLEVDKIVSSGGDFTVSASGNTVLKAGADTYSLSAGGMISSSAGGFSDKYLVVAINGISYKISLLAVA